MKTFLKVLLWIFVAMVAIALAPVILPIIFALFMMIVSFLAFIAMFIFGGMMWLFSSLFMFLGG